MQVTNFWARDLGQVNRRRRRLIRLAVLPVMAVVLAGAGIACSDAGAGDPTPVVQFKITPAPATYTTTVAATPTVVTASSPEAPASPIALIARDTALSPTALTAAPGAITISFSNKDSGVVHNLHVFEGTDAKGKSLGQTDLEVGPVDQELKLDIAPGTYYFQCDAHPTTMKGTLTVR